MPAASSRVPLVARALSTASQYRQSGPHLKINPERLNETIHETCQWGAAHRYGRGATETGMARLALSDDDGRARRWFADETQRLGCRVTVDQMGNMFACRPGHLGSSAAMTAMSSHLDTQPYAGRYDGILGVVAAVEALRTLEDAGHTTRFDVGAVNWTNEEGARFPMSMAASGVWAGCVPLETAWGLRDVEDASITLKSELDRLGFLGKRPCSAGPDGFPLAANFELHIEQGPLLEVEGKKIGVVTGAQAYRWLTLTISGRNAHTGTTPWTARKDAVLAAARMIAAASDLAREAGALASTGMIRTAKGAAVNTLAAEVTFSLDLRHAHDDMVVELQERCLAAFTSIARRDGRGVDLSWTLDTDSPAVRFDNGCIDAVRDAASALVGAESCIEMTSGAGHDSVYTSRVCPTAMIFVPCRDGVSHHPAEFASAEDCAIGAQVLLDAVLDYDSRRSE